MVKVFKSYYIDDDCDLVIFGTLQEKMNAVNNSTEKEISNMNLSKEDRNEIKNYISLKTKN